MKRGAPLKRRTPLKTGKPLRAKTELRRGTLKVSGKARKRVNPVNPKRKARLWRKQFHSREFVRFSKRQPCVACGLLRFDDEGNGLNETAHSACSRANGGTYRDTCTLCSECHAEEHTGPLTFWRAVGMTARRAANEHHARWKESPEHQEYVKRRAA